MHPANRHPSLLRPHDAVVIVIDMQEPFLRGVWERERTIAAVCNMIEGAGILEVPVIATTQYKERMGGVIAEVAARLGAAPVLDKMTFSCWEPGIREALLRTGRTQVILCGVEAHICVSQTAHDLLDAGFQVHVAEDAVSARTKSGIDIGFSKMRRAGALSGCVESALYELLGRAGTPAFRAVLKLIK